MVSGTKFQNSGVRHRYLDKTIMDFTIKTFTIKTFAIFLLLVFLISSCAVIQPNKTENKSPIGVWQLTKYNYGNRNELTAFPKNKKRIKIITTTRFLWAQYNNSEGKMLSYAGGTYTFNEDVYTENIEFADKEMFNFLGKKEKFKINVNNDELYQIGHLSNGLKIEEVWQRIK